MASRLVKTLGIVSIGVAAAAASSEAANLQMTGWQLGGGSATVRVDGSSHSVGYGPMVGNINGVAFNDPLYCLDLYHSFSFGQSWDVQTYIIPPDSPPPPPYNVPFAAWIYNNYGAFDGLTDPLSSAAEGRGVQIALWEVTHDGPGWAYQSDWDDEGNFEYVSGTTFADSRLHADTILQALQAEIDLGGTFDQDGTVAYYKPTGSGPGQGQMGRHPVPEPSVLLVLGMALAGAGGLRLRRRRS